MSRTKAELEEEIGLLEDLLSQEREANETLAEENRRLSACLMQASVQYEKLARYVKTLRDWAAGGGEGRERSGSGGGDEP